MSDKVQTELSIEETNKIRISLGLKPLKIDEPKKTNTTSTTTSTTTTNNNDNNDNDNSNDIQNTINQLKKKRESKLIGKSIAEQLLENGEEDEEDISNWVSKSRENEKKKLEEKKKSLRTKKTSTTEHYSEKNLKGLRVGNDIKNFQEDTETILTLQDSSVLDDQNEDVLINVNIAERERREKQIQENKKQSKYDRFDEYGNNKYSLLSDTNNDSESNKNKNGFSLGDNGIIGEEDSSKSSLRDQVKKNLDYLASYDMDATTSSSILSSFYTQEEMEKFKSRSASKKQSSSSNEKKKKKSIRKSNTDELLQSLDATTSSDLGSRKTRITEKERKEQDAIMKREENYQKALDKASEFSKLTYSSDIFEEAEDEDFYKSLSTSKKAPILSNKSIVDIVNKNKEKQKQQNGNNNDDDGESNLEEITINPTSEFVRSLNPEGLISNYKSSISNNNGDNKIDIDQDDDDDEKNDKEMVDIEKSNNGNNNQDSEEEDDDDDQDDGVQDKTIKNLTEEPLVATSLAATLKLLQQKGELQPQLPQGSNQRKRGIDFDDSESTVIEHKDEFGRVLNRKEAFVKMSQIFHGKKSGKNKQEKIRKRYEEELKRMKMDSTDTPLGMVKSFQSFQEKTASPYLVLSSSNNNTNDTNNNLVFLNNLYSNNQQKQQQQSKSKSNNINKKK